MTVTLARFVRSITACGVDRDVFHGPDTQEGKAIKLKKLDWVTSPETGPGILIVDRYGTSYFIPASFVSETVLTADAALEFATQPKPAAPAAKVK